MKTTPDMIKWLVNEKKEDFLVLAQDHTPNKDTTFQCSLYADYAMLKGLMEVAYWIEQNTALDPKDRDRWQATVDEIADYLRPD